MRTDEDFLAAFEAATLPADAFHHRNHVRVAWPIVILMARSAGGSL